MCQCLAVLQEFPYCLMVIKMRVNVEGRILDRDEEDGNLVVEKASSICLIGRILDWMVVWTF